MNAGELAERHLVTGRRRNWYDGHCPSHADERASFSFKDDDHGLVVLCRAGCSFENIKVALQKKFPSANFTFAKKQPNRKRQIVAPYQYQDEGGALLYEAVRYEPKDFRFRRPDGKGGWLYNLKDVRRVIYRLPNLKGCPDVCITEGEKDADNLWKAGLPATTNPGGAGKWKDEFTSQLKAQEVRFVIVLPDNDPVGEQHARDVAQSCLRVGLAAAVVKLPGLPEKGDVSDWLGQGHTKLELLNLVIASILTEPPPENSTPEAATEPKGTIGGALADRLVGHAESSGVELFHTPQGEAFALIPVKGHKEVWPITSEAFRGWLSRLAWEEMGKAATPNILSSVLQTLAAKARYDGPQETVHLRTALHEGALYYDLADEEWRVVKVTSSGWEVLASSPVRFRRFASMAAQGEPKAGGSLDQLWDLMNIPDPGQRRLLEVWLVSDLMPDIPHPDLVLYGDQGAGKTTTARILAGLIDPSSAPLVRARDEQEFAQALAHHYVAILDNLSFLPEWLSNLLSRAVTGEGFTKRRLYTDDEDVTYAFRRVLILTGINLVVTKPDLLDRSLIISTERVPDGQRLEDRVLIERYTAAKPQLFGALLDLAVKAMAAFPSVILRRSPRMADFARWGAAVSCAQDRPADLFNQDYQRNVEQQNEQAIAESFVGSILLAFMGDRRQWEGTAENLLGYLQTTAENMGITRRDFPSTPQLLGRRLREIRPNLAAIGLDITFSGHHHPRTIRVIWNRRRP